MKSQNQPDEVVSEEEAHKDIEDVKKLEDNKEIKPDFFSGLEDLDKLEKDTLLIQTGIEEVKMEVGAHPTTRRRRRRRKNTDTPLDPPVKKRRRRRRRRKNKQEKISMFGQIKRFFKRLFTSETIKN